MLVDNPFDLDIRVIDRDAISDLEPTYDDTDDVAGTDLSRCRVCPESLTCSVVRCPTRINSPCCRPA